MAQTGKRRPTGAAARPPRTGGARPSPATRPPSNRADTPGGTMAAPPRTRPGAPTPPGDRTWRGRQADQRRPVALLRGSTRRLVVLGGVFVMLAIMLVPTARAYFAQRDANSALTLKVAQQQRTVDDLQREIDRYNDTAYVEQQARARLGMVKPGETAWKVVGGPSDGPAGRTQAGVAIPLDIQGQRPYYERLWTSILLADRAAPGATRAPAAVPGAAERAPTPAGPTAPAGR